MSRPSEGARRCACPCNKPLPAGARRNRLYIGERHKDRAYRVRLEAAAKAAGAPVRQSLETLQATTGTGNRRADGRKGARKVRRAPRPGTSAYLMPNEVAALIAATESQLEVIVDDDLTSALKKIRRAQARLEQRSTR